MIESIKKRRSCRKFKKDNVSQEDLLEIIMAGEFAPSAIGSHAVEYIIVRQKETKEKIYSVVGQDFIKIAPVLIVPVIDTKKSPEPVQDLSVVSENIMLQATDLGYGTVWKNVSKEWFEKLVTILKLPANKLFINLIPMGIPQETLYEHKREDFDSQKIHLEKW